MVPRRLRWLMNGTRGFTMAEILVVVAILGILIGLAIPTAWTWFRAAALRGAGEQTVTMLNGARQLAIRMNTTVCVTTDVNGMQYHVGTCAAAAWTGAGTNAAGYLTLDPGLTFTGATNLCFNYLGAGTATPAPCIANGTITVNRAGGGTLNVIMATTGRVRLQ